MRQCNGRGRAHSSEERPAPEGSWAALTPSNGASRLFKELQDLTCLLNTHVLAVVLMQGGHARNLGKSRWQVVSGCTLQVGGANRVCWRLRYGGGGRRANDISMDLALATGRESRLGGEMTYPGFQLEVAEPRLRAGILSLISELATSC